MKFVPKKSDPDPEKNRKSTTVMVIVGVECKKRFVTYCKKHKTSQTKMIKQMMDHCMGDE